MIIFEILGGLTFPNLTSSLYCVISRSSEKETGEVISPLHNLKSHLTSYFVLTSIQKRDFLLNLKISVRNKPETAK